VDAIWRDPPYRWKHLSNNPNQFALLALPLPFLALQLVLQQHKKPKLLLPIIAGLLALTLGWYGQSDALTLSWVGGGLVMMLVLLTDCPKKTFLSTLGVHPSPYTRRIAALLIILMVAVSAWQWRDKVAGVVVGASTMRASASADAGLPQCPSGGVYNQASVRFCLWRNGLAAIQYAPLTGLGPGPHSGLVKPFEGVEAHNTLLDWGSQTGLVGMVALVAYWVWLLWRVARQRRYELVAMLLALYCFSMFHLVLRQPLFWIIPLLALELATRPRLSISDADLKK
jgi:O-antigen ligase